MYFEDLKNLLEIRLPSFDFLFVVRVERSEECIPFAPLDNVPLNFCDNPAIERFVSKLSDAFVAV